MEMTCKIQEADLICVGEAAVVAAIYDIGVGIKRVVHSVDQADWYSNHFHSDIQCPRIRSLEQRQLLKRWHRHFVTKLLERRVS